MQTYAQRYEAAVARNFTSFMTRFQVSSLTPEQLKKFSEEENVRHHIGISKTRPVLMAETSDFATRAKARLAKLHPKEKTDFKASEAIARASQAEVEEGAAQEKKPFKKGVSKKASAASKH